MKAIRTKKYFYIKNNIDCAKHNNDEKLKMKKDNI